MFVETVVALKVQLTSCLETEVEAAEVPTAGSIVEKIDGGILVPELYPAVVCLLGKMAGEDGGGLVVLFIGDSSGGEMGGGPCRK